MKIWQKQSELDLDRSFKSFLYTITRNNLGYLHCPS
ncbi:hypothetical protein [Flagellimonas sp.]